MSGERYDVAIVGASIGGCAAARLFAQRGARVALIERRPDPDAHKTVCTHYIQSSATPTIERLGLAPLLDERGAVHNSIDVWTPHGGWIVAPPGAPHGYSITRERLDPMLRRLAAETPGVDLLCGWTATGLHGGDRPAGVTIESPGGESRRIDARLLVAADGRGSRMARLAGVRARVKPNSRFFYWAYWSGLEPAGPRARMWMLEPDCAYTFPNEDGLTVALIAPHESRLPEFRAGLEGAYLRMLRSLPEGPGLSAAKRESKLLGKLELPNAIRPAARPGIAFVGDAALAGDPFWGIGCGWAFQSAEWLADAAAPALLGGGDLDAALDRYRRLHFRRLALHQLQMIDFSSGRPANPFERMIWRGAAHDERVVRRVERLASRHAQPTSLLAPGTVLRAALATGRASATGRFASIGSPEKGGGPNLSHMLKGTLEVQGR
jgi:2-polyprenyl-6-methoxyphenol hydroxylase-like FAD-dependent oxidoreductase